MNKVREMTTKIFHFKDNIISFYIFYIITYMSCLCVRVTSSQRAKFAIIFVKKKLCLNLKCNENNFRTFSFCQKIKEKITSSNKNFS
ncbi:hypothetical protein Avbf_05782 [Armadillidium vulgare]|nr:hypothetical protein Avbf_05782 [Armadillidium vulgare]